MLFRVTLSLRRFTLQRIIRYARALYGRQQHAALFFYARCRRRAAAMMPRCLIFADSRLLHADMLRLHICSIIFR